jgi:polar amino acid transport system substrate-binding protein
MKKLLTILLIFSASFSEAAQISVTVNEFKPNAYLENGSWRGFEIDLLNEMGYDPQIEEGSIKGIFSSANYDMAMGAVSITSEREAVRDFSTPYQNSGLKVMMMSRSQGFWGSIASFEYPRAFATALSNPMFWQLGFWYSVFVVGFSFVIWLTQKGREDINDRFVTGMLQSIYFSVVTSSTVGYGDLTLKNFIGRACALGLIITGISFFCNFTGLLGVEYSTQEAKYSIAEMADLKGKRIGVKEHSTGHNKALKYGANVEVYGSFGQAAGGLTSGDVEAVLFDGPAIDFAAKDNDNIASIGPLCREDYGFVFPEGSELKEEVDQKLLALKESGRYNEIVNKWF